MKRLFSKHMGGLWTRELVLMALVVFFMRFGEGMLGGARTNFFVDTLGLDSGQVLLLEGLRELPGLALMFIAALVMHLPLSWRAAGWVATMGIGYMLYATAHSFTALVGVELIASLGMHGYQPISPALGMCLASENTRGRVMGRLASVGSLATIVGMGVLAATSGIFQSISLRLPYALGGILIIVSALLLSRLPKSLGATEQKQPRMLLKRRYWLYYVLTFFEGARKQVLNTFGTLVLAQFFGWKVWQISSLLLVTAVLGLVISPYLGALVDRYGSRRTLAVDYAVLILGCVGYAAIKNPLVLAALFVTIRLSLVLNMALSIYVNQIAPAEELLPTLSAGVSINHISSVAMPLIAGLVMPFIGYNGIFLGTAVLIALSVPFVLAMQAERPATARAQPALAK